MARTYQEMTKDELLREQESLLARYKAFQAKGLQLDMSRGKPCKEQLDLSVGMNDVKDYVSGGVDVRNYGILDGIASCKQLFCRAAGGAGRECDHRPQRESDFDV